MERNIMKMKLYKINFLCAIIVFIICIFTSNANACVAYDDYSPVDLSGSIPDVSIQRDAAVGSILFTQTYSTGKDMNQGFASCSTDPSAVGKYTLYGVGAAVSGYKNVYETSVPGVGITVATGDSRYFFSSPGQEVPFAGTWQWSYWGRSYTITLTKINPATGSGNTGQIRAVMSLSGINPDPVTISLLGANIKTLACSINNTTFSVPMGDIPAADFTGTGSTPKSSTFDLGMDCDADANINITLRGTQTPDSDDMSIISLSNYGQPGVADGVGVQLLYGGKPINVNELINLEKSSGGQESLPFTVRYIQTKGMVKPGSANATLTLDITYQ